jgi:hypothetical protein
VRRGLLVLLVLLAGCTAKPVDLTPEAGVAFQASRVVKALDVVRDAAIAANDFVPPILSTNSTRTVVLWHKTAVQVIQVVPSGWKATVRMSIFVMTCDGRASDVQPPPPCTPQLGEKELAYISPYIGLVLIVIREVQL